MPDSVKDKIRQLYQFLREANQLRFRPVRSKRDHPKVVRLADLPNHPSVQLYRPVGTGDSQDVPDTLLRVRRPPLTRCPTPPDSIGNWLLPHWDDPSRDASAVESINQAEDDGESNTIRFDDDEQRVTDFLEWIGRREAWQVPELAARAAMVFYETCYDIYASIEKDGEDLELLVADGNILWQANSEIDGSVVLDHPVLFKRVELRFDPDVPEFTIHETDREVELYTSLFVDLENVAPNSVRARKAELERAGYHPLGWDDTDAFLKAFIQTVSPLKGEYAPQRPDDGATATPRIYRDMVVILRKRVAGIANAIDAIVEDIEQQTLFPPALAQITGTLGDWEQPAFGDGTTPDQVGSARPPLSEEDILLAKEANEEQLQIIKQLERSGSVLVQGPPGTGKTHTIGNLVGHLLAQGKSVLITAQTAKALRVVRDQVPSKLRPLAVSVLGSDQDARRQLEVSIASITERLTRENSAALLERAAKLEAQRKSVLSEIASLTNKLREALENEYRDVVVDGKRLSPSEAARFVATHRSQHSWIPGPARLGKPLPLTEQELIRLYALGESYSSDEERNARGPLPDLSALPSLRQFQLIVSEYEHLAATDLRYGSDRWEPTTQGSEPLEKLLNDLAAEFSDQLRRQAWRPYAIVAGVHGGAEREVWLRLIVNIEAAVNAHARYSLQQHQGPQLSDSIPMEQQREVAIALCAHLKSGGKLGIVQLATRPQWRQFIRTTSVAAGHPDRREHFEALRALADLSYLRQTLASSWDTLIGGRIGKLFKSLGEAPEQSCRALIPEIKRCLNFHTSVWLPLTLRVKAQGLKLEAVVATVSSEPTPIAEYTSIENLARVLLPPLLIAEVNRRKARECEMAFRNFETLTTETDSSSGGKGSAERLISALRQRSVSAYTEALDYARRLHAVAPLVAERDALAAKLELVAPGWAAQIVNRVQPHDKGAVPGDVAIGWAWRQCHDMLVERDQLDADALQRQLDQARTKLRELTELLVDARSWGRQLERLQRNQTIRQALVGWLDTTKRLVSTRRADRRQLLLTEARKLMGQCAEAVPVWVMPISILADSFNMRTTRFDVVIIDEASQADLNALIPLYLGKQVIVVGDHEQVTPLGVGQQQVTLHNLQRSMLQGIPNSHLFDHQSSIYDIARQSFGDAIRLVEHFRCVPEIIAYSNQLSYGGKIRPLRESNSTDIKPACVSERVDAFRDRDVNHGEATRIVELIQAMLRHPRYSNKSIGVISMLGDEQARLVQSLLHKHVSSVEIERRRILAGIPGEFQGDERDIIFLSMVDSPTTEGPLRSTGEGAFELTKKRFNVAASRARDQLIVVHSFDPDLHLKSSDLRLKLLQHVSDPLATIRAFHQESAKTESPFEREVLRRLASAGYQVKSQWEVGYYRIDMVVEGGGKRLAVECDGDRFHPMENLAKDIERQTILERLGWNFVRIRGSAFYRAPDDAMHPVFARLNELEIPPESAVVEQPASDLTLWYELDAIVERDIRPKEAEVLHPLPGDEDDVHELDAGFAGDAVIRKVLASLGGSAPLDALLRDVAKAVGYSRMGRKIRLRIESDLEKLVRTGAVAIVGDRVRTR